MKRIDRIYETLVNLYDGKGVSAIQIASTLNLDRSNVSRDLNTLHKEGLVSKIKGKPVLFSPIHNTNQKNKFFFDSFVEKNPSLYSAVELAKAAILYPPNGMNMLILGETGVGKSMFANLVYKYGIGSNALDSCSPFIVFNCADYTNNPQLLLSQLFGVKKGAYTGAETDRKGLIEKADGGILFLDEVHRLPPEGQEMFFKFMDNKTFRRMGETNNERKANVLIIAATTENPNSVLLQTFNRRIPMVIEIPNLKNRTIEERFTLINDFFKRESRRLEREIYVSTNSIKAFLSYNCPNNIGQLKADIQVACAKAYANYISNKKDKISIRSLDLPTHIKEGLFYETEHRQLYNKLINPNQKYFVFKENTISPNMEYINQEQSIYEIINSRFFQLKSAGISESQLEKEMERDIYEYFKEYVYNSNKKIDTSNIENLIEPSILDIVEEIIYYSEKNLNREISKKTYYGMAIHISNSISRIKLNKEIVNPQLKNIRNKYPKEFEVALNAIKIIERRLDFSMPIDEAGFLTMFLIYDNEDVLNQNDNVKVIVVAHGTSTATSMADTANKLLGTNYAIGINAPLDEKPQNIIHKIEKYLEKIDTPSNVLFLVDMGSFTTFGHEIEKKLNIKTKTIQLASTLHVIEATRKAIMGYTLEQVYQDTLKINTLLDSELLSSSNLAIKARDKLALVTICTTGEGGAVVVKNFINNELNYDKNILNIIPINIVSKKTIYEKLEQIEGDYRIIGIITPFEINTTIEIFKYDEIFSYKSIGKLQDLINIETTYIKMGDTLENQLENICGHNVLKDIKKFNTTIEEKINKKIDTNSLIGISFHLACLIDNLVVGGEGNKFENKKDYIKDNKELYNIVKETTWLLNDAYDIYINDDCICYIMKFFKQRN